MCVLVYIVHRWKHIQSPGAGALLVIRRPCVMRVHWFALQYIVHLQWNHLQSPVACNGFTRRPRRRRPTDWKDEKNNDGEKIGVGLKEWKDSVKVKRQRLLRLEVKRSLLECLNEKHELVKSVKTWGFYNSILDLMKKCIYLTRGWIASSEKDSKDEVKP